MALWDVILQIVSFCGKLPNNSHKKLTNIYHHAFHEKRLRYLSKFLWYVHRKKNWYDGKKRVKEKTSCQKKKKIGQRWAQLFIYLI